MVLAPGTLGSIDLLIPAGEFLSQGVDCTTSVPITVFFPPNWNTQYISYQLSIDNIRYSDLFDPKGYEVTSYALADAAIILNADIKPGWIKIRSGTRDNPVIQPEDVVVRIMVETRPE